MSSLGDDLDHQKVGGWLQVAIHNNTNLGFVAFYLEPKGSCLKTVLRGTRWTHWRGKKYYNTKTEGELSILVRDPHQLDLSAFHHHLTRPLWLWAKVSWESEWWIWNSGLRNTALTLCTKGRVMLLSSMKSQKKLENLGNCRLSFAAATWWHYFNWVLLPVFPRPFGYAQARDPPERLLVPIVLLL